MLSGFDLSPVGATRHHGGHDASIAHAMGPELANRTIRRMRLRLSCAGVIYLLPAAAILQRPGREEERT
jgi:hypothetical protein